VAKATGTENIDRMQDTSHLIISLLPDARIHSFSSEEKVTGVVRMHLSLVVRNPINLFVSSTSSSSLKLRTGFYLLDIVQEERE
jgi:hypothetical protein